VTAFISSSVICSVRVARELYAICVTKVSLKVSLLSV